jgi:siderophore synthetase component
MSIDAIRKVLPEGRFIHIIRDGRDVALSLRRTRFSPGPEIETQAAYWRECVLAARRAGVDHQDYLEVRYEDLILNTRQTLNQICTFIEQEYHDAMLRYYTRTPVRLKEHKGRSDPPLTQHQRILQQLRTTLPPDPARVFAWKSAMSLEERERFQMVAGTLLNELEYEV